jgi:hypothetical protein
MTPTASRHTSTSDTEEAKGESSAQSESKDAPYYCPGCGKRGNYPQKCTGRPDAPHPEIEMVSTDELSGDPEKQTAAPDTTNLG